MPGVLAASDELATAKRHYFEAVEGNSAALKPAIEILTGLQSRRPGDALVEAYLGSSRLLESARTMAVWKKGRLAKEGLQRLDEAVRRAPDDAEVRFLRAASTFHLPGWFGRRDQSEADFALLARPDGRLKLDDRLAAAALYFHGVFRDRAGDKAGAREAWREAARLSPASRAGRDAAGKLGGG